MRVFLFPTKTFFVSSFCALAFCVHHFLCKKTSTRLLPVALPTLVSEQRTTRQTLSMIEIIWSLCRCPSMYVVFQELVEQR